MTIEQKSHDFAVKFHADQKRKYTFEPYINHCINVANIVRGFGGNTDMYCAAILHDTVEDTTATLDDIKNEFGNNIMQLVWQLTDVYTPEAYPKLNRRERKLMECERISGIHPHAKTIKLADLIDNTSSIVKHDPSFAKVYLKEKAAMLEVLIGGNEELHKLATQTLNDAVLTLNL